MKNPIDAWMLQEIIYETKPDVIIEIGSYRGGSTLYLAHLLDILGKGVIISIDADRTQYHVKHSRITALAGNSSSQEIIQKVSELCHNKSTMVLHDGNHNKDRVLKDLRAYSAFVSVNNYLIVEDGYSDLFKPGDGIGRFGGGPLLAVEKFLKEAPNFIIDKERERYILTYNPNGFLKRIK